MSSTVQNDFFSVLRERQAVKHYDPTHKLSEQDIKELIDMAHQAPSSWNLQHWKFLIISDEEAKQKLLPIAYGQKQIREASATVVILGDLQANLNIEAVYEPAVQSEHMPGEVKKI